MDKISIIIPVYNVELYLRTCLDSVINQTFKNIEIILINDGSTDDSLSICKQYEEKDKRIKLINKKNGGVSSARNEGLKICTGKYVTFIDSDDYVANDYIETLYNKIKKYNVDIVLSNAINICEGVEQNSNYITNKNILFNKIDIIKEILNEKYVNSVCWGNLYSINVVKNVRFDPEMRISEDMKFLIDVIKKVDTALIIPEKKYYYVIRNDSLVHTDFNSKWYDEINYCRELVDNYRDTELEKYSIKRYVRVVTSCMYRFKINKDEYLKLKKRISFYFVRYLFSDIVEFKLKIMYLIVLLK